GIRDKLVTGVQTCALPIFHCSHKELIRPKRKMDRDLHDKIVTELGKYSPNTEIWPTFYGEALGMGDEIWDRIDFAAEVGCQNLRSEERRVGKEWRSRMARV